jgi:hypothetical protein
MANMVATFTPGTARNDGPFWVGGQITPAATHTGLWVTQIGTYVMPGATGNRDVALLRTAGTTVLANLAQVTVNLSAGTAGTFAYVPLSTPVLLNGASSYAVLAHMPASSGNAPWSDNNATGTTSADFTNAVSCYSTVDPPTSITTASNFQYVGCDLVYTTTPPPGPTWVQTVVYTGGSAATIPLALTHPVGSGNLIIGFAAWIGTVANLTGITDDKGNSYSVVQSYYDAATGENCSYVVFSRANVTGNPQTITLAGSGWASQTCGCDEYQGVSALDTHLQNFQTGMNNITTDAVTSGALTSTNATNIQWAAGLTYFNIPPTSAGTGWAGRLPSSSIGFAASTEDRTTSSAGSTTATFTSGSTNNTTWYTAQVGLKVAAVGPPVSSATLSGVGTVAAAAIVRAVASVAPPIQGSGGVTVAATLLLAAGSFALAGIASVTAAAGPIRPASAPSAGSGQLAVAAGVLARATAPLGGLATVVATAASAGAPQAGSALLTGAGSVAASASLVLAAGSGISGLSGMALPGFTLLASVPMAGLGSVTASASSRLSSGATVAGVASVAAAFVAPSASVFVTGQGTVGVTSVATYRPAVLALGGSGSVSAAASVSTTASTPVAGLGSVAASAALTVPVRPAVIAGQGSVSANLSALAALQIAGTAGVSVAVTAVLAPGVVIAGSGHVTTATTLFATALIAGQSGVAVAPGLRVLARTTINGVCSMVLYPAAPPVYDAVAINGEARVSVAYSYRQTATIGVKLYPMTRVEVLV